MRYAGRMDAETMRTVARLARSRADRGSSATHGDGLERLGAARALRQLAVDLEVSADACEANPRPSRGRGRPTLPRPAPAHVPYGSRSLPGRAEIRRSRSSVGAARSAAGIELRGPRYRAAALQPHQPATPTIHGSPAATMGLGPGRQGR